MILTKRFTIIRTYGLGQYKLQSKFWSCYAIVTQHPWVLGVETHIRSILVMQRRLIFFKLSSMLEGKNGKK